MSARDRAAAPVHRPRVVLLVGEPGSGKTELGFALSRALNVPFLARDQVRRGLYITAGAWSDDPGPVPASQLAVETFLQLVETMVRLRISCIVEYVFRSARPEPLRRITEVADCVVIRTRCANASARRALRDGADPLLSRSAVVRALGFPSSADAELARAARMHEIVEGMLTAFDLPLLEVVTEGDWLPPLDSILEFATRRS